MAIIKCKMCGGDIELSADKTYGTCDSCGSTMTLPKIDDEHRANLFNRANHFRRQNEFDKAVSAYERILDQDDTDAEAHWGVVLSRFGIEYVKDPVTHERIPTCHRVQMASILTDVDYLAAIEHAPDGYSRSLYEAEAKRIAEIQKGILAISAQEKPYDVFICYKETTDGGSRTKDSTIAQDIYYQLKQEGFKVFFSRITLEDKLGQQYEPYIFAALNSAKVMLVIGTKPEYFTAVWVKNEWSRYLALMKEDRSRLLIPCYRDMDAYDLPDELSALQSQDMSKIGFMQDLLRGVKKVLTAAKPQEAQPAAAPAVAPPVNAAAPLLRRAFMFLEDGDWQKADDFCEQVLNMEPENAQAYLGKMLADMQVKKTEDLKELKEPFDKHPLYQKVMRFADGQMKAQVQGYIQAIIDRNEYNRKKAIVYEAVRRIRTASTVYDCPAIREKLEALKGFDGVAEALAECDAKHESICSGIYKEACALEQKAEYPGALRRYEQIPEYRDAKERASLCEAAWEKQKADQKLEDERKRQIAEAKAREAAAKKKKIATIVTLVAVAIVAVVLLVTQVIVPNQKYDAAVKLMEAKRYEEAIDAFDALDGYRDSYAQIRACRTGILDEKYDAAVALMNEGKYNEAITAFSAIKAYKDSADKIKDCETAILDGKYNAAVALMNEGKYAEAYDAFIALNGHKDSAVKAESIFDKNQAEKRAKAK